MKQWWIEDIMVEAIKSYQLEKNTTERHSIYFNRLYSPLLSLTKYWISRKYWRSSAISSEDLQSIIMIRLLQALDEYDTTTTYKSFAYFSKIITWTIIRHLFSYPLRSKRDFNKKVSLDVMSDDMRDITLTQFVHNDLMDNNDFLNGLADEWEKYTPHIFNSVGRRNVCKGIIQILRGEKTFFKYSDLHNWLLEKATTRQNLSQIIQRMRGISRKYKKEYFQQHPK